MLSASILMLFCTENICKECFKRQILSKNFSWSDIYWQNNFSYLEIYLRGRCWKHLQNWAEAQGLFNAPSSPWNKRGTVVKISTLLEEPHE